MRFTMILATGFKSLTFFLISTCVIVNGFCLERQTDITFDNVKRLSEIFEFQVAFTVEQNEHVVFDMPRFVLMTENGYFLSDEQGQSLMRYHADGSFDRMVAVKGEGPQEVQRLSFAARMFDGQVGVFDHIRSRILVFSEAGDYRCALDLRYLRLQNHAAHVVGSAFAWPRRDALFLGNVIVNGQPDTQAAWTRVKWASSERVQSLTPTQWVAGRPRALEAQFGSGVSDQLVLVDDQVWLGHLYLPHFERVAKGKTSTTQIRVPNALTEEDYQGLDLRDHRRLMEMTNAKGTIHGMLVFNRFVLVKVGVLGWVPFDHKGRQLAPRRIRSRIVRFADSQGDIALVAARQVDMRIWKDLYGESFALADAQVPPDPDQPMLVLLRLKAAYR